MEEIPGGKVMGLYHQVKNLEVKKYILSLEVDGKKLEIDLKQISPVFRRANSEELQKFELSPSGYGIHWPLLDEDVSIDGLLGIVHSPNDNVQTA
jgi:hypothetical protein